MDDAPEEVGALLDWRRRVAALYARVQERYPADPAGAHADWVTTRERLFREHPSSPLPPERRPGFALPVWPYDPGWALRAPLDPAVDRDRFPIATSGTGTMDFVRLGRVAVAGGTLEAFWLDAYGGGLFVPFRDATCGAETYGGGRYLLDTAKSADLGVDGAGNLILDFNFAYHPSCAWDAAWACPLAPPGNRLEVAVRAGERLA